MPIPWIEMLRDAIATEYQGKPAIAALATISKKSDPRVRFVVCRNVEADGSLWFVSDHRSEKNANLRSHPLAEVAFYLANLRQQFRLHGPVEILSADTDDARRQDAWKSLTDASRALFHWPAPGAPFDIASTFTRAIPAITAVPENFELLILRPDKVGHLDVMPHPHHRRCWRAENDWEEEELNP